MSVYELFASCSQRKTMQNTQTLHVRAIYKTLASPDPVRSVGLGCRVMLSTCLARGPGFHLTLILADIRPKPKGPLKPLQLLKERSPDQSMFQGLQHHNPLNILHNANTANARKEPRSKHAHIPEDKLYTTNQKRKQASCKQFVLGGSRMKNLEPPKFLSS